MPVSAFLMKALSVALEYGMLFFLLLFVLRLSGMMFRDIRKQEKKIQSDTAETGAALTVLEAQQRELMGRRFAFSDGISIGRGKDNDIVIPEGFVSHHHLVIYPHKNLYVVEDLGSINPAELNDEPLRGKAYLKDGDRIRIGFVVLRFER
ncbi:MAG: FHA domain-containing protein [Selenomonadaceae bacterium]|nr:FHA domain-containing protein [Selenomonadaceae bacterium]MBR6342960.1 FHA domain-containing protein [Selenomonadaceae bacterium]MBR6710166.1 FHA domain-containing protein [Selenomonadaceae bacterium]MBR6906831.1 FHA domain-containing protein [Selenomonadaceae bacterium]